MRNAERTISKNEYLCLLLSMHTNPKEMKYTAEQIKDLSILEWTGLMAKELNEKGYWKQYIVANSGQFSYRPYHAVNDLYYFLFDEVNRWDEIDWLVQIGLINNGRCMLCGKQLKKKPVFFRPSGGLKHTYTICEKCATKNKSRIVSLCPKYAAGTQVGSPDSCGECDKKQNGNCGAGGNKAGNKMGKREKSEILLTVIVVLLVLSYII